MKPRDHLGLAIRALSRYPLRSSLVLLAMAIGVAAVIVLTSLGEAARRYVVGEFASLGTNLVIVLPGRSETTGGSTAMFVNDTPRDLTLGDAMAIGRSRAVRYVAPIVVGTAAASWGGLEREVPVIGATAEMLDIRRWTMAQGRFLPHSDMDRGANVCVIGAKVRKELFGGRSALGEWLRVSDRRFRVIGVIATEGRSIGVDVQEVVILPVASVQALFNTEGLFRVLVEARSRDQIAPAIDHILTTIRKRHQGNDDVTIVTQDAVIETFDRILRALTFTVAGIAAISLAVAGILIMNVMLVSVSQRTREIGLLKALGSPRRRILLMFLTEATVLAICGGILGLGVGQVASLIIGRFYPALPLGAPWWAVASALTVALLAGLAFGALPARRAAGLDPVDALANR